MSLQSRQLALAACAVFSTAVAVVVAFFGRYAFDDSYVGYTYARNLLLGHGFSYNVDGGGTLSTSAPLAVPLYALIARMTGHDVIWSAQLASAVAMFVLAGSLFAIARRIATPFGAAVVTISIVASPFVILVWSHETLLYVAALAAGVALVAYEKWFLGAFVVGLAALFRGEALIAIPFIAIPIIQRRKFASLPILGLAIFPYIVWLWYAHVQFGTFFSQTIGAKQAQALYPFIMWYGPGLLIYVRTLLAVIHTPIIVFIIAAAMLVTLMVAANRVRAEVLGVLYWSLAVTLFYILLHIEFYFWFTTQLAVAFGALLLPWWLRDAPAPTISIKVGRAVALVVLALELSLTIVISSGDTRYRFFAWDIGSHIASNPYRELGEWFAHHTKPHDSIGFSEFGQLRYYSNRNIVEYLGLVTPGATERLRLDNPMWAYEKYRPNWIVDATVNRLFVDPTEYDWFANAYLPAITIVSRAEPRDPDRSRFTIYRLTHPNHVPPAMDLDTHLQRESLTHSANGISLRFLPGSTATSAVEFRAWAPAECPRARIAVIRDDGFVTAKAWRSIHRQHIVRLTLAFAPLGNSAGQHFTFEVRNCFLIPKPHPLLRTFSLLQAIEPVATPMDAFRAFIPSRN